MPTYQNANTATNLVALDTRKVPQSISPGDTIETYETLNAAEGWVLVSASPYWNPSLQWEILTLSGVETKTQALSAGAKKITVFSRAASSGNVALYLESEANTPHSGYLTPGRAVSFDLTYPVSQLVLVSTGNATVDLWVQ